MFKSFIEANAQLIDDEADKRTKRTINVDPRAFATLGDVFSALPGVLRAAMADTYDRNAETDDVDVDARDKRAKRARRATAEAAASLAARRASRLAKLDEEDPGRVERRAKRAANAELRAEREEARRAKAARKAAEAARIVALRDAPLLGVKQGRYTSHDHDMTRDQWLAARAKVTWRTSGTPRNPWEAQQIDAAMRAASHSATALALEDEAQALRLAIGASRDPEARRTLRALDAEAARERTSAAIASDASTEARTLGDTFARYLAWARGVLLAPRAPGVYHAQVGESGSTTYHRRGDAGDADRDVIKRLMDPEVFAAHTLLARWLMD